MFPTVPVSVRVPVPAPPTVTPPPFADVNVPADAASVSVMLSGPESTSVSVIADRSTLLRTSAGGSDTYRFHFDVAGGGTQTHTFVFNFDPTVDDPLAKGSMFESQYISFLQSFGAITDFQWTKTNSTDPTAPRRTR